MNPRRLACLASGALALLTACDTKAPMPGDTPNTPAGARALAPPSSYSARTGHVDYAVPGAWSTSVRIVEEPGASAEGTWPKVQHAVHFVYQPSVVGVRQETVLSILAYDDAAFDKATTTPTPLAGREVARANGRVFAALLTPKNPYVTGSADHDRFASLQPALAAVQGAITPR